MRKSARLVAAIAVVLCVSAVGSLAGLTMTSVTKGEGGRGSDGQDAKIRLSLEGQAMKTEYISSRQSGMPAGTYLITRDGGKMFFFVNSKKKTYSKFDMASMGAIMQMMKMDISESKIETLLDEKGPEILGYPTRHYKLRMSYKMEMSIMGMKRSTVNVKEDEIWATAKFTFGTFDAWQSGQMKKLGNPQLVELFESMRKKVHGLPLKSIITSTTTDESGKTQVTKVTTEVVELKEGDIPASEFMIPADYKEEQIGATPDGGTPEDGKSAEPEHKPAGGIMNMFRR